MTHREQVANEALVERLTDRKLARDFRSVVSSDMRCSKSRYIYQEFTSEKLVEH